MTLLRQAAVAALRDLLAERRDLVVVGVEPALATLLSSDDDPRLLPAEARAGLAAIGAGLALGGRKVITLAHGKDVAVGPLPTFGQVLLTTDPAPAARWWSAGATVTQPASANDVAPLLVACLEADTPVVLRLDNVEPARAEVDLDPPRFGTPRWHARGPDGVLVGAGRNVGVLRACVRWLAAHNLHTAAADVHTLPSGGMIAPTVLDGAVLVGGPQAGARVEAGRLDGLLAVSVGEDLEATARAVLGVLPAPRPR